ncbi:MAG: hypothetical protein R2706_14605 [Acidimicrobiales bacterium]
MSAGSNVIPRAHPASVAVLDQIAELTLPTKRHEAWRHAPHAQLAKLSFGPASSPTPSVPASVLERIPALDGPTIVLVNGVFDAARSTLTSCPED